MTLRTENLSFYYHSGLSPDYLALSDINLTIDSGEIVGIVGATGSGKTTLIQHFNGLLRPTSGRVFIDSIDLSDPRADLNFIRQKVGLVFQFPEIQLFEETVYDDIAYGPRHLNLGENEIVKRIKKSLSWVDLDFEQYRNLSPFQLSGGEKRRIAIAGILAMEPEILILDEPTAGLDWRAATKVEDMVLKYHERKKTVVFVSHDMDLVGRLASKIIALNGGRIGFIGLKEKFFSDEKMVRKMGLDLPQVCQFMHRMKKKGYPVETDVFTIGCAKEELKKIRKIKMK